MRPIALVGNVAIDHVDGDPPRIGGGPFYGARALRQFGRPGRIVTSCAEADRPALIPGLVALGVPVTWRPGDSTAEFSLRYVDDRREMTVERLGPRWEPADARVPALERTEWVHVAPLARSEFPSETLAALADGRRLSFDGQGLVRPARTGPLELDADVDLGLLSHVTVLKLAEEEAEALVGRVDQASLGALGVPEVVVTYGLHGSVVMAEGRLEEVKARAILDVDPTGAGDSFAVAYLAARSDGFSPFAAARRATALVAALLTGRAR
jgi:sugar/nucleoside kinase (ribokinase family)